MYYTYSYTLFAAFFFTPQYDLKGPVDKHQQQRLRTQHAHALQLVKEHVLQARDSKDRHPPPNWWILWCLLYCILKKNTHPLDSHLKKTHTWKIWRQLTEFGNLVSWIDSVLIASALSHIWRIFTKSGRPRAPRHRAGLHIFLSSTYPAIRWSNNKNA